MEDNNEQKLLEKLQSLERNIKRSIETLASRKAWYHVVENLKKNPSLKKHLKAWVMAEKKIGAGKGKKAKKYKKIAQQEMEYCKNSIPCWIMPLYKVVETITPEQGMYDYVIIDEASQLGPDAIFLLFISKKIIIVGDDEQTSPEYVGVTHNTMTPYIERDLKDIPFSKFYGTDFSFFDHARFFCDGVTTLREHFRCMPEIIEFSNRFFYRPSGKTLYPLRQYSAERLEPLATKYCPNGFTDGRGARIINKPEAEEIAKTIANLVNNPKYDGKTFGVIVLQGNQQAKVIENLILKKIGEKEYHDRNIVCGNSASFQGDERDVIFLSLVTAHNHRRRAFTKRDDERRFNVAISRAKDQAFLFHSVQLGDLSNTDDLRYKLLNHFQNYRPKQIKKSETIERSIGTQPDPFDSWFEVDVYNDIVGRGYSVIPQYEIANGRYRIDMVALLSNGTKIAIECDGDKWHGPEQYQNDINRQRVLERSGWEFFRIRGYEYYSNREKALEPLWERLEKEKPKETTDSAPKERNSQESKIKRSKKAKKEVKEVVDSNKPNPSTAVKSIKENKPKETKEEDIEETVIRYFNLDENNNYYMSNGAPTGSPTSISIKKYQKDGFLLQCYESGHINKVSITALLSKNIGRVYKNGSNPNDKLKSIEIIDSDKIIGIYFEEDHQRKFKAHLTDKIPSRDQLHLKGKKVMYNKFSNINYKLFPLEMHDKIKRLIFKSFNANGKPISNSYYSDEWEILKKYDAKFGSRRKNKTRELKQEQEKSKSKDLFKDDSKGNQWETSLNYWSSVELPGYRYSKKKNAWWKRKDHPKSSSSNNKKVSLNNTVKIEILENNEIFKVKLTSSKSSKSKKNGVQLINYRKPLAVSIKGKRTGDKVKIGNTGNYVKILEIY